MGGFRLSLNGSAPSRFRLTIGHSIDGDWCAFYVIMAFPVLLNWWVDSETCSCCQGASPSQPLRNTPFGRPPICVVRTHERIAHVLAAVLVYLYIFLSLATGPPLRGTAPTFPLQRPALAFGTLGLLLICGANEPRLSQSSAVQRRTSSNIE